MSAALLAMKGTDEKLLPAISLITEMEAETASLSWAAPVCFSADCLVVSEGVNRRQKDRKERFRRQASQSGA